MYTEDYNKRGFPLRNFLLKLILIIVFVFLLCWLLPKFMVPAITKSTNGKGCSASTCECTGVKALTSQIFADNIEKMKNAAISYYTDERLPQEVGQSKKMTLSDMIGLKIIVPLIDKNNKAVDVEKSYVKITKTADEYILKVNIKDSEKEDYILVHIGCYTYCEGYLCQKKDADVPAKSGKDNPPYVPVIPDKPVTIACVKYNGNYYDKNGKIVSYEEYKKSCVPEVPHFCVKYDGKYYNNLGKVVSYEQYKKDCMPEPEEKYYCVKHDGKYYDDKGNVVSYEEYRKACLPEEVHICVKYNGKYYDDKGNVVTYEEYKKACESKKDYIYEYQKVKEAEFSAWTAWSAWAKTDCSTQVVNCNDKDVTCLMKLQRYNRKEQIGTYQKAYAKSRQVVRQTGSYTEKACSKYNYVIINNTTYATTTTTKYTQTNVINAQTQTSVGGWTYVGRQLFNNPPRDTETMHYKFAGADYSYCSDTCTTLPNYYYDVYQYTGGLTSVINTTSTPGQTTSTSSSTTTSSTTTTTSASCGEYTYKTIPIYSTITVTEKAYRTEPLYGDVCYQSTKTRKLISKGSIQYKWSYYNDTTLLNNGWSYTGNRKIK